MSSVSSRLGKSRKNRPKMPSFDEDDDLPSFSASRSKSMKTKSKNNRTNNYISDLGRSNSDVSNLKFDRDRDFDSNSVYSKSSKKSNLKGSRSGRGGNKYEAAQSPERSRVGFRDDGSDSDGSAKSDIKSIMDKYLSEPEFE